MSCNILGQQKHHLATNKAHNDDSSSASEVTTVSLYAVQEGNLRGIFDNAKDFQRATDGFPGGARYAMFSDPDDALTYMGWKTKQHSFSSIIMEKVVLNNDRINIKLEEQQRLHKTTRNDDEDRLKKRQTVSRSQTNNKCSPKQNEEKVLHKLKHKKEILVSFPASKRHCSRLNEPVAKVVAASATKTFSLPGQMSSIGNDSAIPNFVSSCDNNSSTLLKLTPMSSTIGTNYTANQTSPNDLNESSLVDRKSQRCQGCRDDTVLVKSASKKVNSRVNKKIYRTIEPWSNKGGSLFDRSIIKKNDDVGPPQPPGKTAKMFDRHYVQHNYHDFLDIKELDIIDKNSKNEPRGGVSTPFPVKLHEMLENSELDGHKQIVSWRPHGRAFIIFQVQEFESKIMPRYFNRQSKHTSLQRQLNLYGFTRLSSGLDAGAYYHELFLRGKLFLARQMIRTKVKGWHIKPTSNPGKEPNFYAMKPAPAAVPTTIDAGGGDSSKTSNVDSNIKPLNALDEERKPTEATTPKSPDEIVPDALLRYSSEYSSMLQAQSPLQQHQQNNDVYKLYNLLSSRLQQYSSRRVVESGVSLNSLGQYNLGTNQASLHSAPMWPLQASIAHGNTQHRNMMSQSALLLAAGANLPKAQAKQLNSRNSPFL